jgi:ABC-type uncharacterized transport system permease subunit
VVAVLSGNKGRWAYGCGMAAVYIAEGFAHYLFGQASAFAALAGNAEGFADIAIATAAVVNGFADLTVGNTLAEANVHKRALVGY